MVHRQWVLAEVVIPGIMDLTSTQFRRHLLQVQSIFGVGLLQFN
jgi:hypothetical protein